MGYVIINRTTGKCVAEFYDFISACVSYEYTDHFENQLLTKTQYESIRSHHEEIKNIFATSGFTSVVVAV